MKTRIDSGWQERQNMNWDEAGNNWQDFQDLVRRRWRQLSDEQIEGIAGRREKLLNELQRTYGLSEREAEEEIKEFETGGMGATAVGSARGPTERMREASGGNEPGGAPRNDRHRLH